MAKLLNHGWLFLGGLAAVFIAAGGLFVWARGKPSGARQGGDVQITIGQAAPSFTFKTEGGETKSLEDFRGKTVVLYFYPKDETPGCTREACSFRDRAAEFERKDAVILGVSADDEASHEAFRKRHGLPFALVPDPKGDIARSYGVFNGFLGMAKRQTFVIDREGRVEKIFRNVAVDSHAGDVLEAIGAAGGR